MRRAAVRRAYNQPINRGQKAQVVPMPPPVGGWNARDALAAMPPEDAVVLDNWFPGLGSVRTRGGGTAYSNTLGGAVRTVFEFNAKTTRKFLAMANGKIWDISAAGAGISLATGFASDVWDCAQFDDASGGARMGLVNGSDAPQQYDGTAVTAMTISGPTVANLNGIQIHKARSYFWDDRTQDFWYSATNALGGVLTKFPLGRLQNTGGNLMAMTTWSVDAGNGPSDNAVFIMTSGVVLVYAGSDPGDATNWSLIGRYNLGAPISKRAVKKIGADVVIATKSGYVSLAQIFQSGDFNQTSSAISTKIRQAAIDAAASFGSLFGWHMQHYPNGNYALINVPTSTTAFQQHVFNTETKAWCRFTGQNALCWGLYNDNLYYGTANGTVVLADSGTSDIGVTIQCNSQTAWNYLGAQNRTKRLSGLRLSLTRQAATLNYLVGVGFDYKSLLTTINQNLLDFSGSTWLLWEASPWDTQPWGGSDLTTNQWCSASGSGYVVSIAMQMQLNSQRVQWLATNYLAEPGGII